MDDEQPKPDRKRRRSEKRKRTAPVPVRYLPEERAEVRAAAEAAGMSLGGFIRSCTLRQPKTRARREPSVAVVVLLSVKAELNRVGGHIYQIAKHMNFGGFPEAGEVHAALGDYYRTSAAVRSAIDRERESR
jgi:hypothetical protein